jgi:hypothetical protein
VTAFFTSLHKNGAYADGVCGELSVGGQDMDIEAPRGGIGTGHD